MAGKAAADGDRAIATNRRARHDYHIVDTVEAGLVLTGTEVKSLREGKASLAEAYATVRRGEVWLAQAHIPEYSHGNRQNHEPTRERKLLLHRREIDDLDRFTKTQGRTVVPLKLYWKDGRAKVLLGMAEGKRQHDKRAKLARRDADRQVERALKAHQR
jgi:SsrA-binding protein